MADPVVKKAVPADQERTEITPMPHSFMAAWAVNTDNQQTLDDIIASPFGRDFIGYLREFSGAIAGEPTMNGDRLAGIQMGARMVVEEILNMTKQRQTHIRGMKLQRRNAQVPIGMPPSRRPRPLEQVPNRRILPIIEPQPTQ